MIEGHRVAKFVMDTLTADVGGSGVNTLVGGRIRRDRLGQTMALPGITVTLVPSTDTNTMGGRRVFAVHLVDVRVVGDGNGDYGPLVPIADRVDTVLQNAAGLKDGVVVVKLRRESLQEFVEDDSGKPYTHIIQTYRSEAHA